MRLRPRWKSVSPPIGTRPAIRNWPRGIGSARRHGFVRTGQDLAPGHPSLQTSRHGVFAIGDVRAGSVKRVAAAVGEGAQVVAAIHAYLAEPVTTA